MQHRYLALSAFTLAAIEDILARGRMPDWVPLIAAIRADPYREIAEKTRLLCESRLLCECPLYAAPAFRRALNAARNAFTLGA